MTLISDKYGEKISNVLDFDQLSISLHNTMPALFKVTVEIGNALKATAILSFKILVVWN